ncbi:MAG: TetR family transcriptional regulator C-terminal domain-containing protein [Aestuariivirga sp.]
MTAATLETPAPHASRKASKDVRRQQLIDATISVLARKGYAALTVADVAKAAGLSAGIINFHFDSKDGLLADCLQHLTNEFYRNWKANIERPGATTAERLRATLLGDFDDAVFSPDKLRAWIAFWGESQGRPVYEEISAAKDVERSRAVEAACAELIADGGYALDSAVITRALEAMLDGLWLDVVSTSTRSSHIESAANARQSIKAVLHSFFPKHFPQA